MERTNAIRGSVTNYVFNSVSHTSNEMSGREAQRVREIRIHLTYLAIFRDRFPVINEYLESFGQVELHFRPSIAVILLHQSEQP